MTKLTFATNNKNKIKEVSKLIPGNLNILSLEDINCKEEIPETQGTIKGNAFQKAEYVKENYKYDCFADDTGLEVDALNGAPGVRSARYAGEKCSSEDNVRKLLKELKGKPNRRARFRTVIALIIDEEKYSFEGVVEGSITEEKRGGEGFGYDPVFLPDGYDQTFAEMPLELKNKISHRAKATKQLVAFLEEKI